MKNIGIKLGTLGLLAMTIFAPMSANADAHRQDNKNVLRSVVSSILRPVVQFDNDRNRDRDRDADRQREERDQRDNRDRRDERDHRDDRGNDGRSTRR